MIESFAHKGLKRFFAVGDTGGIQAKHAKRLQVILSVLQRAKEIRDVNFQGMRLHPLKGELKGYWSVTVQANWRIIFRFERGHVYDVDYIDYH